MAGFRKKPGHDLVMQRVWRGGRPVTPNGPGGRLFRRGRATAIEPGRLASEADITKGFPRRQRWSAVCGPRLAAGVRYTHPLYAWRSIPTPIPCPAPRGRGRTARAGAGRITRVPPPPWRARRGIRRMRDARTCRSGPRAVAAGVSWEHSPPTSRGGRASRHPRQRCPGRRLLFRRLPGSPGRFLRSVRCPFLVHRSGAVAGLDSPRRAVKRRLRVGRQAARGARKECT